MNRHGNPTSKQIAIGKLDEATGELIPNSNYFNFFPEHKSEDLPEICKSPLKKEKNITQNSNPNLSYPFQIRSCGIPMAMMKITEQIGLLTVLQQCFPEKWNQILAVMFYMVSKGNVMSYISDWFEVNRIDFVKPMNNITCGELFESLSFSERHLFFSRWIKYVGEQEYITFDVTSISTYSEGIELAEWGYNRDGDSLMQLNFGMCYAVTSCTPVYYDLYSGSITDKSHLAFVMQVAKEYGITKTCFVFDGTFVTENNLSYMFEADYSFISAFSTNRDEAKCLIDEVQGNIEKMVNRIGDRTIYGVKRSFSLYGSTYHAYIYYSPERKALESKSLYEEIDKLKKEIEKLNKSTQISRRFTTYFKVSKQPKNTIKYELDIDKVDEKIRRAGFFILISSDGNHNCEELLKMYREKDIIEKNFHQLKNDLDFRRLKTHWNRTTDGKMFIGFLALILRTNMHSIFRNSDDTKKYTFEKILIELSKIHTIKTQGNKEIYATLTKKQKDILKTININLEEIIRK